MEVNLQRIRKLRKLSQSEVAEALGVKVRTYGSWERGEAMLNLKQAYDCALVLDCAIDEIAGLDRTRLKSPDPRRQSMVDAYDALTDDDKTLVSEMVASVARDPLRRADTAGSGSAGLGPQKSTEEMSA